MLNMANLDIILQESSPSGQYGSIYKLTKELATAKQTLADIEHKITMARQQLSADMALRIRKIEPGFNVAVDKNGCKIGYKTKFLHFAPDIETGMWVVTSNNQRFLREFLNAHRKTTLLDNDVDTLIAAIVEYFTSYYRTLNDDINGTGLLLIENKNSTLLELVGWRQKKTIMSRAARGICSTSV